MRALPSKRGGYFILAGRLTRQTIPIEDLKKTIEFYKRLRDRQGGRFSKHYVETVQSLELLREKIREVQDGESVS